MFELIILPSYTLSYYDDRLGEEMKSETKTLAEVRENIDRLDDQIIKLISEREFYVKEASKYKNDKVSIDAPKRVELVIQRVRTKAKAYHTNEDMVENLYRNMINDFIQIEKAEFHKMQSSQVIK